MERIDVPRILDRVPVSDRSDPARLPNGNEVRILPYQIIVWASLASSWERTLDLRALRFPVVLDTAFNHNFLIREDILSSWTGFRPEHFPLVDYRQAYGRPTPWRAANLWIYRNIPCERDRLGAQPPFRLQLDDGIGICTSPSTNPRLPLLGLRALFGADLQLSLDCRRGYMSLRTPRRFWLFG